MAAPMPRELPVTTATFPVRGRSAGEDIEKTCIVAVCGELCAFEQYMLKALAVSARDKTAPLSCLNTPSPPIGQPSAHSGTFCWPAYRRLFACIPLKIRGRRRFRKAFGAFGKRLGGQIINIYLLAGTDGSALLRKINDEGLGERMRCGEAAGPCRDRGLWMRQFSISRRSSFVDMTFNALNRGGG
jgi:hypothetical protein